MSLPVTFASDLPALPPENATPQQHVTWCENFARYCDRRAEVARKSHMSPNKWRHAAEMASFAASIWRDRMLVGELE